MDIDVFSAQELPTVFRVLRTALRPSGLLDPRERVFLDAYAQIHGLALAGADPRPLEPEEVHIEGAHQRKRLVQLSAVAVLLSAPVQPESVAFVTELARDLKVHDPVISVLRALEKKQYLKVK